MEPLAAALWLERRRGARGRAGPSILPVFNGLAFFFSSLPIECIHPLLILCPLLLAPFYDHLICCWLFMAAAPIACHPPFSRFIFFAHDCVYGSHGL